MKKTIPTTPKSRYATGYHKHLRPEGKRVANKGTRKVFKEEIVKEGVNFDLTSRGGFDTLQGK